MGAKLVRAHGSSERDEIHSFLCGTGRLGAAYWNTKLRGGEAARDLYRRHLSKCYFTAPRTITRAPLGAGASPAAMSWPLRAWAAAARRRSCSWRRGPASTTATCRRTSSAQTPRPCTPMPSRRRGLASEPRSRRAQWDTRPAPPRNPPPPTPPHPHSPSQSRQLHSHMHTRAAPAALPSPHLIPRSMQSLSGRRSASANSVGSTNTGAPSSARIEKRWKGTCTAEPAARGRGSRRERSGRGALGSGSRRQGSPRRGPPSRLQPRKKRGRSGAQGGTAGRSAVAQAGLTAGRQADHLRGACPLVGRRLPLGVLMRHQSHVHDDGRAAPAGQARGGEGRGGQGRGWRRGAARSIARALHARLVRSPRVAAQHSKQLPGGRPAPAHT